MEVVVKARFNASKERIEKFGGNKYVIYLPFSEDEEVVGVIKSMLSRYLGVPEKRIELQNRNSVTGDFVFLLG